jgi:hypothetical protein
MCESTRYVFTVTGTRPQIGSNFLHPLAGVRCSVNGTFHFVSYMLGTALPRGIYIRAGDNTTILPQLHSGQQSTTSSHPTAPIYSLNIQSYTNISPASYRPPHAAYQHPCKMFAHRTHGSITGSPFKFDTTISADAPIHSVFTNTSTVPIPYFSKDTPAHHPTSHVTPALPTASSSRRGGQGRPSHPDWTSTLLSSSRLFK